MRRFIFALPLILAACSATQVADTKSKADEAILKAREEINMACWAMQTADVAFQTFVAAKADPSLVDAVNKAVAVANAICPPNEIPSNVNEALAAVFKAYKAATAATAVTGI